MQELTLFEFVALVEFMLRLKTPGHERFFQSPVFEATCVAGSG
jgi:2-dehydro-3-deoxygluconokinase